MTKLRIITPFIIYIISCTLVNSQEYKFKIPNDLKVKITTNDSYSDGFEQVGDTIEISFFDNNGNKVKTVYKSQGKIESNTIYRYDKNKLIEYADKGRILHGMVKDSRTGEYIEVSEYDSTLIVFSKKYFYQNEKISRIEHYDFGTDLITKEFFKYDYQGRVIKHLTINFPNPHVLVYFKHNSLEIDWNHPKQTSIDTKTKICSYSKNMRITKYYDSTELLTIDSTFFNNDLVIKSCLHNAKGDILTQEFYQYDLINNLIEYKRIGTSQSIYDTPSDEMNGESVKYKYDTNGFLTSKEYYENGKVYYKQNYTYVRK